MIFTLEQWIALSPILITGASSVVVMIGIAALRQHQLNATLSVMGLNSALLACALLLFGPQLFPELMTTVLPAEVTPLLHIDNYSIFYMGLILSATLATSTLAHPYFDEFKGKPEEFYLLLSLSALGGLVLACSNHLASLFIGVELLSVPLLAMIAYPLHDKHALEAAVKYLILSAAASAFLLLGMALIYADSGTLSFPGLAQHLSAGDASGPYIVIGSVLLLVAVGFKLSLVPFHLWTPDVYEGAPAPVTAFLSTASKTAIFAVLLRFFTEGGGYATGVLIELLSGLAALSIVVGNLLALRQDNLKRLLAYSSIAHFGYALVALIAAGALAVEAVNVYLLTYVVTNLGAFGIITLVSSPLKERDADHIEDYRGLFWRRPFLTAILTAMLLSLAGIPVTAGFIGKFYILAAAVDARQWLLIGAVVFGSAVGLFYYLRVISIMFMGEMKHIGFDVTLGWEARAGGLVTLLLMLLMLLIGILPDPFLHLISFAGLSAG